MGTLNPKVGSYLASNYVTAESRATSLEGHSPDKTIRQTVLRDASQWIYFTPSANAIPRVSFKEVFDGPLSLLRQDRAFAG